MGYGITGSDIDKHIARKLGFQFDNLTDQQQIDIDRARHSGYRRFLDTPGHEWSFLRVIGTIDLVADQYKYDAPNDFQSIIGTFTYQEPADLYRAEIKQIYENHFRRLRQQTTQTYEYPCYFCVNHKIDGSREFWFYPTPKTVYTLEYRYHVEKQPLESGAPLGGDVHSETVLAACMAAAERMLDETVGIEEQYYQERLRASIEADLRNRPRYLGKDQNCAGQNLDDGDMYHRRWVTITHANQ